MKRALVIAALLQQACIAHGIAGIGKDDLAAEDYSVPPAERDAKLTCGNQPCDAAPVQRPYARGRSSGIFWPVYAAETVGGIAGTIYFLNYAMQTSPQTIGSFTYQSTDFGHLMVGTFAATACLVPMVMDIAMFGFFNGEYGKQRKPWALSKPLMADYRGMQARVDVGDVVPYGANVVPLEFSVAAAIARSKPKGEAMALVPSGAKLTHGKIAVLDLKSSAKDLSADDVRYFGDLVRGATLKAAPQLEVMTRENLVVLLQASGKDLANCEGECEVDTGRRIGADAIVSGEVLKIGTRYKLTLRLHDTHEGKLIGAAMASGKSIDELDDAVGKAARELFGSAP